MNADWRKNVFSLHSGETQEQNKWASFKKSITEKFISYLKNGKRTGIVISVKGINLLKYCETLSVQQATIYTIMQ